MRLDKFLKISLIFKTRSSAEKAILRGNVLLNDSKPKPASRIRVNDKLVVISPLKKISYEILELKEKNVSKKEARDMVKIIGEEGFEI